jgi:hypothetical protein
MDVEIGGNLYRNTDGTIEVDGVPQLSVGLRKPGGPLLVNFVAYDEGGRVVAKLVESALAVNERRAYEVERTPAAVILKNREAGKVTLKVELKGDGRIVILLGDFITIKSHRLEISPAEWRINKQQHSGGDTDAKGGGIAIG